MDPNAALAQLRAALSVLLPIRERLLSVAPKAYKRDSIDDLLDSAAALDAWLSKGGWLPDAWAVRTEDPFPRPKADTTVR